MGRVIALDYGKKRTGIAVTDPLQIIATALTTVETKRLIPFLKTYSQTEKIDTWVIGLPKKPNGQLSDIGAFVHKQAKALKKAFPTKPILFVDERFTTKIARQTMIETNVKKTERRKKSNADKISAVLILQSYMASSATDTQYNPEENFLFIR